MTTDIENTKAVLTWLEGLEAQSGVSREDGLLRVPILADFCALVEKQPDQIIDECLREADGVKKIRAKGRRFYADAIVAFEKQADGAVAERRQRANYIRSFLIHNGVLLQTSPLF
jgi:hypothetical protein